MVHSQCLTISWVDNAAARAVRVHVALLQFLGPSNHITGYGLQLRAVDYFTDYHCVIMVAESLLVIKLVVVMRAIAREIDPKQDDIHVNHLFGSYKKSTLPQMLLDLCCSEFSTTLIT